MARKELKLSEVSARLDQPQSDVWAVHSEAIERQAKGEDILLLSVGDPDFDTPSYISEHVIKRINQGRTHYSPAAGEPELRRTIADLECRLTGRDFDMDSVVIFPGATATLYAALASLVDYGDGVLVPEPMYIGYQGIFATLGVDVQTVPLAAPDFVLDLEELKSRVRDNTRVVMVNTPGNPCGNIIPPATLTELANFCYERNLWLICDEVYSLITYEKPHVSMLKCAKTLDNVLVIDGLSKSHAMSGWRIGWAIGAEPVIAAMVRLSNAAFFGTCQFVQDGGAYALANDAEDVELMRQAYQRRRDLVLERLQQIPRLSCYRPDAGMFVMLDGSQIAQDGDEFCRLLLNEAGISTIPGSSFGPSTRSYVRMSLTLDEQGLSNAMDRLEKLFR